MQWVAVFPVVGRPNIVVFVIVIIVVEIWGRVFLEFNIDGEIGNGVVKVVDACAVRFPDEVRINHGDGGLGVDVGNEGGRFKVISVA